MSTIITAALSGFVGALAGGGISLLSQIFARKWQRKDGEYTSKKEVYVDLVSIGSHYIGWEVFKKINKLVSTALLISGKELRKALIDYCARIEQLNCDIDENPDKQDELVRKSTTSISLAHEEIIRLMRKELDIKD
jgi:hypothetical protein